MIQCCGWFGGGRERGGREGEGEGGGERKMKVGVGLLELVDVVCKMVEGSDCGWGLCSKGK